MSVPTRPKPPVRAPNLKGLKRFVIPHGLYVQRTGQLNRALLTIYRKVRRKSVSKPQAKTEGEKVIREHRLILEKDCVRYFKLNNLICPEPKQKTELDKFTNDKVKEWTKIVDDI